MSQKQKQTNKTTVRLYDEGKIPNSRMKTHAENNRKDKPKKQVSEGKSNPESKAVLECR